MKKISNGCLNIPFGMQQLNQLNAEAPTEQEKQKASKERKHGEKGSRKMP